MTKLSEEKENKVRTVKEMNPEEQPREKAEKLGCHCLSVAELWAIILRTGSQGLPITELCRQLMERNKNSIHKLERRTRREIMDLKGVGLTKCIQIEAVLELIKRYCNEEIPHDEAITTSSQIFRRMKLKIGNLDHEEIWVLLLNRRNQILKEIQLTSGTGTASLFDLKMVIKQALLENAESMILCHNHPSGSLVPSIQDDKITKDLHEACKIMKLNLLDHIIVTAGSYYSYRDSSHII